MSNHPGHHSYYSIIIFIIVIIATILGIIVIIVLYLCDEIRVTCMIDVLLISLYTKVIRYYSVFINPHPDVLWILHHVGTGEKGCEPSISTPGGRGEKQ